MKINNNVMSGIKKLKEENKTEEKSLFNVKDILSLRAVKEETIDIFSSYKALKLEQTKGREEPWWSEMSNTLQVQADVVRGLGITGKGLMASTIVSGIGAIGVGAVGIQQLKEGIKEEDLMKTLGGTTAILASLSGGANFVALGVKEHGLLGAAGNTVAAVANSASIGFGVAFGVLDVALGTKELISGIKEKNKDAIVDGGLEMGIGSTIVMSVLGIGGPVTAVTLGGLFGAKLLYDYRKEIAGLISKK